jgi:hypothetical protein
MNKAFWKAALNRALRTVAQTLVGSIPTGVIVTAEMVKGLNINALWAVLAWLVTGLLAGLASILTSLGWGIPEANSPEMNIRTIYLDEEGREIDPNDLQVEPDGTITVLAYDDYYDDGSPKSKGGVTFPETVDEPCEDCNLTKYVEGGMNDD